MKSENMKALYIVVNAGFADDILDIAREAGIAGATIVNSRGKSGYQESFMGINMDQEKEMIICVVDDETADNAMDLIKGKCGYETPAHSICFTMSVDKFVGGTWLANHPEAGK